MAAAGEVYRIAERRGAVAGVRSAAAWVMLAKCG